MALSHSATHSNNYAVVLGEVDGRRKLPIVIGGFEAQAIAVAMEDMVPNRPLTHDLFKDALKTFKIHITEVVIHELVDGIFHALLICESNGEYYEIDSRTSDAIAMAVRFKCPIYTYNSILEEAGLVMEGDMGESQEKSSAQSGPRKKQPKSIAEMNEKALNDLLQKALKEEDYEKAAEIRDELNRRKS